VTTTAAAPTRPRTELAAKVPAITVLFWIIKTLTTGMGEALSDFLANTNLVVAIAVGVLGLAGALWLQLRSRSYKAPVYWPWPWWPCSARWPPTASTSSGSRTP
jgi:uncharacterized membrane-anchored protein